MAMVEEIFEAGSEEVDDKDIVKAFLTEVINIRDTS